MLDVLDSESLIDSARDHGIYLQNKLESLKTRFPNKILEIRGRGLMLAIAMHQDPAPLIKLMREEGLLVVAAAGHVLRILPPLTVSQKELDDALGIIEKVLQHS